MVRIINTAPEEHKPYKSRDFDLFFFFTAISPMPRAAPEIVGTQQIFVEKTDYSRHLTKALYIV